jgi:amino acid adenylation domain-containing protein
VNAHVQIGPVALGTDIVDQDQILLDFREGKYSAAEVVALLRQARSLESPLSENQHGLWLLQELEPTSTAYNVPFCVRLNASLDIQCFKAACELICKRHPVLTSTIAVRDGVPVQLFRESRSPLEIGLSFDHQDVSHLDEQQVAVLLRETASVPFKLAESPPIRFAVFTAAPDRHLLLFVAHHIAFDGASTFIFLSELFQLYESLLQLQPHGLPPLKASYGDFVAWEAQFLKGSEGDDARRYWLEQLNGALPRLTLPIERADQRAVAQGKSYSQKLDDALTARLKDFFQSAGGNRAISHSALFLGVYQLLLHKYTGDHEIIVGMPVLGRPKTEFESLLGYFVNMIAIRSPIDPQRQTWDFLVDLDLRLIDGIEHSAYPFARLVGDLGISSAEERYPVFQVAFAFQSRNLAGAAAGKAGSLLDKLEIVEDVQQRGEYKLSLEILDSQDGFIANFKYDANRFADREIAALASHYLNLLESVLRRPQRKLSEHSVLSAAEHRQLVYGWNDTACAYPQDKCLHELFAEQVERTPDAIAVEYEEQALSYRALNERANQVAHYLIERGVKPDTVVGLCLERSLEMIVGLLGIIKAGAAYVPLDPSYPAERIEYILRDCGAPLVFSQQALVEKFKGSCVEWMALDEGEVHARRLARQPTGNLSRAQLGGAPADLVHVIYTSGSTGRPKGVLVEQRGVVRLVCGTDFVELDAEVVMLQHTTLSFDVSAFEIWAPLLNGGRLVVYGGDVMDIPRMMARVSRAGVNTIALTPSLLQVWLEQYAQATPSVKTLVVAGEALAVASVVRMYRLNPQLQIIDAYGPTENSVYSVAYRVPKTIRLGDIKPIGLPIAQSTAYVMDGADQLVPVGCVGELYVGGAGVARGYLNQPALTAQKFIDDPFSERAGARLYKTGDLVRRLADGNIEYLGRRDHQVKIRGFRIELGEIESRLLSHPSVQSCVVLAREDTPGDKRLVAYYTAREGEAAAVESLRAHLKSSLPEYMAPSAYVPLPAIPMTPNGKVDRRALPAPEADAYGRAAYEAPQGEIEEGIATAWRELLHVDAVGRHDNFFELGGHSLLAMQFMAQIQAALALELQVKTLFEHPSVERFAASVQVLLTAREQLANLHRESDDERQVGAL